MSEMSDELVFAENLKKLEPILETLLSLTHSSHLTMQNQRFRLESNNQVIAAQEKTISENRGLIEDSKNQAKSIISMAEEKVADIEKGLRERMAQINHMEREAKKKVEEAERKAFDINSKKAVKV